MVIKRDTRINKKYIWDFRLKSTPLQDQRDVLVVILNLQRKQRVENFLCIFNKSKKKKKNWIIDQNHLTC